MKLQVCLIIGAAIGLAVLSGCQSSAGCPQKNEVQTKDVVIEPKEYQCYCTKCGNSWTKTSKPTKCPACGSKAITYTDLKTK